MNAAEMPLLGPPPAEVPLPDAPLVRVIAQVRFPLIASVERREFIAAFQEAIRREYPVLRPEQSRGVTLSAEGVTDARKSTIWRFHDRSGHWRATLAMDFVAIETTQYSSRDDFLERFRRLLVALESHIDPQVIERVGVRYIDRVVGDVPGLLPKLVRPEVGGILGTPLADHARHSIVENVFDLPDGAGRLTARWGLVPPRGTVDPAAVDAIDEPSWLLDVDAFRAGTTDFDVDAVVSEARRFAERIYALFRWVVTDEFLRRYGGQP